MLGRCRGSIARRPDCHRPRSGLRAACKPDEKLFFFRLGCGGHSRPRPPTDRPFSASSSASSEIGATKDPRCCDGMALVLKGVMCAEDAESKYFFTFFSPARSHGRRADMRREACCRSAPAAYAPRRDLSDATLQVPLLSMFAVGMLRKKDPALGCALLRRQESMGL